MRQGWMRADAVAVVMGVLLLAGAARAQEVNCAKAVTQADMNFCADQAWKQADEDLNLAYGLARTMMVSIDAALPADQQGAVEALKAAQRAWITFRDQGCAAEGFRAAGGSMQPMVISGCMERVTRVRTEELRSLGETW